MKKRLQEQAETEGKIMKILAFSGKKQSGKNTAVNAIKKKYAGKYHIVEINFADRLKEIVLDLFVPAEWNWAIKDLDVNKDEMLPLGKTVRQTLQWFGTDVCRKAYPDVWVNVWRKHVKIYHNAEKVLVLTADVRFTNEVKAGQDLGGHVIRLLRAPFPEDKHESETALDNMDLATTRPEIAEFWHKDKLLTFDAVLDNCKMSIEEQNEAVWKLVKERNWI